MMLYFWPYLVSALFCLVQISSASQRPIGEDYLDHPCRRICHRGEKKMLCEYAFKIEWYTTMSRACFDCPNVAADCLRLGCIPTTGVSRPIITANRQFPGPTIEVCKGDRVRLTIENAMQNGETTTIHFHGLRQKNSPYMDGTPMVSQCPIQPGTKFTMEFEAEEPGTHFWHAHSGVQRADGLAGSFIVRDADDPHGYLYGIDNHAPIILQDWFENDTVTNILAKHHYAGAGHVPSEAILINGRYGTGGDRISETTIKTFNLDSRWLHRFRIINNAFGQCPMNVKLESHYLIVIAVDGQAIKVQPTRTLIIYPGERYDFIPHFNGESISSDGVYLLKVTGEGDCADVGAKGAAKFVYKSKTNPQLAGLGNFTLADEIYSGKRRLPLKAVNNETLEIDFLESMTDDQTVFKRKPDTTLGVDLNFERVDDDRMWPWELVKGSLHHASPRFNQITFRTPPAPLMSQFSDIPPDLLCSADKRRCSGPSDYCECIHMVNVAVNSLVEMIFIAHPPEKPGKPILHTLHIHGYKFHILAMETPSSSNLTSDQVLGAFINGTMKQKSKSVLLKDTFTVPPGGYVIVRFIADSPGIWLLHSQMEDQMLLGMTMAIGVGTVRDLPPPPPNWPKCGDWELKNAGTVKHSSTSVMVQGAALLIISKLIMKYY